MAANNTVSYHLIHTVDFADDKQLDRLIGLAMLIIASTVFLYYTIWTLLIVCHILQSHILFLLIFCTAVRRRLASRPIPFPTARLGNPNTRHIVTGRRCGGWELLERRDDTEQSQEGCQSRTEKVEIDLSFGDMMRTGRRWDRSQLPATRDSTENERV